MEFLGPLQGDRLDRINDVAVPACESVDAAIAYIHDDSTLIRKCFEHKKPLHLRGRYDSSKPVGIAILEKFLRCVSQEYRLTLVPDIFHPKVIWWRGYGAYIGSANLTNAAWFGNIEAGMFLDEEEIDEQEIRDDLNQFFDFVDQNAHPLSNDIVAQLRELKPSEAWSRADRDFQNRFRDERLIPPLKSLDLVNRPKATDRREAAFLTEWNATLKILGDIGEYRPSWVPEEALLDAFEWWSKLKAAPGQEDRMITQWAVELRDFLRPDRINTLNKAEFIEVCRPVHAFRNHSQRIRYSAMGLPQKLPQMKEEERIDVVAAWLHGQRSLEGKSPLRLIDWVLYSGAENQTPKRLFAADRDMRKKVPQAADYRARDSSASRRERISTRRSFCAGSATRSFSSTGSAFRSNSWPVLKSGQ